ncbi:septal ring lytic transglycosylase RlpA family protein [Marinobacter sp. CHS3-4]|uniref:septal ring lytic transglycosylase RlpA family protein n=1 Tax=Marinobacter sp. CHS3-4 TaxID=3045174 RepID=UPI0024B55827|nr:septal ring lytic transglycosylase RlpA family protein [Marinobacter sp. CHS3-4]MDI9246223.1 septal ring lytic transglycosylase RlpA family protein [Marinobacter sp. CHS3-4]
MVKQSVVPMLVLVALAIAGCSSTPDHSSRYSISQDRAPAGNFDVSGLQDAQPRYEKPRSAGNKSPYTVWGKSYRVMSSNERYVQQGTASWYGEKFHGHKTSNGEIFNMYAMSAAHKSLRIPSYARVTNLDNGRSVIVRVNDRGPFHGDRLIDLSYAAAKKLGYLGSGTARVEVAAINVRPDGSMTMAGKPFGGSSEPIASTGNQALFVQLGSFSHRSPAQMLLEQASQAISNPMRVREIVTESGRFHRVQVGPFHNEDEALEAQTRLEDRGFKESILLTDNH